MDLDQLQSVRDRERQTDKLQQLRESFYEDAADFVRDLRAERDEAAEAAAEPFDSPRVNRLTDRIRTAEQTLEAIYEKRVGKVVKAATFAAADLPAEADGMTKEEAELFETLVAEIEANRTQVLDRLAGDPDGSGESPSVGEGASTPGSDTADVSAADVMGTDDEATAASRESPDPPGDQADREHPAPPESVPDPEQERGSDDAGAGERSESDGARGPGATDGANPDAVESDQKAGPADGAESDGRVGAGEGHGDKQAEDASASTAPDGAADHSLDRELVRITDDVGPILGVDEREYDLAADDVVTLPAENARPLVERGAAERLE